MSNWWITFRSVLALLKLVLWFDIFGCHFWLKKIHEKHPKNNQNSEKQQIGFQIQFSQKHIFGINQTWEKVRINYGFS